jgi:hypothetical protein
VPADAEGVTEVPGEGTDVGARGTFHRHVDVHDIGVVSGRLVPADSVDVEAVDGDRPGSQLDIFPGADAGIGALTVDLDGADAARDLLDLSRQGLHAGADGILGQEGSARPADNFAFGVVGDGGFPQADGGRVGL